MQEDGETPAGIGEHAPASSLGRSDGTVHSDELSRGGRAHIDTLIPELMRPHCTQLEALDSIPDVSRRIAEAPTADVGIDMRPFENAKRLAS